MSEQVEKIKALLGYPTVEPDLQPFLDAIPDVYAVKRAAALDFLSESWVHHPDYDPALHPHHAPAKRGA